MNTGDELSDQTLLREIEEIGGDGFRLCGIDDGSTRGTSTKTLRTKTRHLGLLERYRIGIMANLPTFVWTSDPYESLRKASVQENLQPSMRGGTGN